MRKFIAIGIVVLLAVGLIADRGLEAEPAITAAAASSIDASGQLADLGPVTLITNEYLASVTAPCLNLLGTSVYFASFTSSGVGASGTITTAIVTPTDGSASISVAGGTVNVLGTFFGPCGDEGATVTGSIDDGGVIHTYALTINT